MHTKLRYLQSLPGAMLPEPESILNKDKFPALTEHPSRAAPQTRARFVIDGGTSQHQAQAFHSNTSAGASPSMRSFGCPAHTMLGSSASRHPTETHHPMLDLHNHLLGSSFGKSCSDAQGGKGRLVMHELGREPGRESGSRSHSDHN